MYSIDITVGAAVLFLVGINKEAFAYIEVTGDHFHCTILN